MLVMNKQNKTAKWRNKPICQRASSMQWLRCSTECNWETRE